jgi:hypothetical protein
MSIRYDAVPELLDRWDLLTELLGGEGIGIAVADYGGYRTAADTTEIQGFKDRDYAAYAAAERRAGRVPVPITGPWENGNSRPIQPYGSSYHNYGAARDFTITQRGGLSERDALARVQSLAEAAGLRSGKSFGDDYHLELPITLAAARELWAAEGGTVDAGGITGAQVALGILAVSVGIWVVIRYVPPFKDWD